MSLSDDTVAALQLLMSDLTPDERCDAFRKAFDDTIIFRSPVGMKIFEGYMHKLYAELKEVCEITDGSSGLGVVAVKNLHTRLRNALAVSGSAAALCHVNI